MISVEEATSIVLSSLYKPLVQKVEIEKAVGRVLAESIVADRDFPPFSRVAMDGIAISFASWKEGKSTFFIEAIQAAGEPQRKLNDKGNCIEVMTGAMLPEGTDTVIMYEEIKIENRSASVLTNDISIRRNVHASGQDVRSGDVLLNYGMVLSPAEIALLASVGKNEVDVLSLPKVSIVSSGDELVAVDAIPAPHQIRRSNTYALKAAMLTLGCDSDTVHLPDQKESIVEALREMVMKYNLIILSGGVSKGKFDYIPDALKEIGVKKLFHQVNQRPGKPFWFGVSEEGKIVFALPGNPVSTYMCFYRYIKPWLYKSLGMEVEPIQAELANDFSFAPNLTYFLQVEVKIEKGKLRAYSRQGGGSGDFANLKQVNGFLELSANRSEFKAGEVYDYFPFRNVY